MPRKKAADTKAADQTADSIFDQVAAPAEAQPSVTGASGKIAADDPRVSPGSEALKAAFDAAVTASEAANTPAALFEANADGAPSGTGIDFAALSERQRLAREAGHNAPIDTETGAPAETAFFLDLTKAGDFELVPAGTRAVVTCTAADAVISSAGNPMLNVRVKIERVISTADMSTALMWRNRSVKDRLMFIPPNPDTGSRGTIWRVQQAFKAFGVEYDPRAFRTQDDFMGWLRGKADQLVGLVCVALITIDDGTSNGTKAPQIDPATNEPYPSKNAIGGYYVYNPNAPINQPSAPSGKNDDLPF